MVSFSHYLASINNVECHNKVTVSRELWHNRFGHAHIKAVENVLNS